MHHGSTLRPLGGYLGHCVVCSQVAQFLLLPHTCQAGRQRVLAQPGSSFHCLCAAGITPPPPPPGSPPAPLPSRKTSKAAAKATGHRPRKGEASNSNLWSGVSEQPPLPLSQPPEEQVFTDSQPPPLPQSQPPADDIAAAGQAPNSGQQAASGGSLPLWSAGFVRPGKGSSLQSPQQPSRKGGSGGGKKVKPPKRVKGLAQEEKGRKGTRGGQKAAEQTAKTGAGSALSVDFLEELAESV